MLFPCTTGAAEEGQEWGAGLDWSPPLTVGTANAQRQSTRAGEQTAGTAATPPVPEGVLGAGTRAVR